MPGFGVVESSNLREGITSEKYYMEVNNVLGPQKAINHITKGL
jgi:hypothetical protein